MRTLKSAVKRELKRWQATNPHARKFAHSLPAAVFLTAGRSPVLAAFTFLVVFATACIGTLVAPPPYIGPFNFGPDEIDKFSVDTLFTGLWATQATLVALVYPVGFGFATIFLQKSHATKATLQSYLVTSGAKLTGTCGLALLAGLTILASVVSAVPHWTAFSWLMLGAGFLCVNILLTANFLLKTFAFATPDARRRERHSYAVAIAWPAEWRRHAAAVFASDPVRFKLIEADELRQAVKGANPVFHASEFAFQEVVDGLRFSFKGRRLVSNVRYWLVQLAYDSWLRRAEQSVPAPPKSAFHREGPVFVLRLWPSPQEAEHGDFLAGTTAGPRLNRWEKFLLWWSVRYVSLGRFDHDITVRDCLDEIRAELSQAISEGASDDFDRQLMSLLVLLDDLLEASYCVDGDGRPDNQALSSNSDDHFSGASVLSIWIAAVSDILKCGLAATAANPYFAAKLAVVPKRLLTRERKMLSHGVRALYLEKQHEFFQQVLAWGSEQNMLSSATSQAAGILPEPLEGRWRTVLVAALGAWESLKNEAIIPYGESWTPWGETGKDELNLLTRHLELSVALLASTSRASGITAARHLVDSVLRWKAQLAVHLEQNNVYIQDPWELTIEAVSRPWAEVKATHLQGHSYGSDDALKLEAWSSALANYWRDCCGAVAATVAYEHPKASREKKELAETVLRGLLFGDASLDVSDGGVDRGRPFADANEFVLSLIRQHVVDGGYREGYRRRLDNVVKAAAADNWDSLVPGRTVSLRAPDSLEDVGSGQLMCLCLLADDGWSPSVAELKNIFRSWGEQDARRGELDGVLTALQNQLRPEFETLYQGLWSKLVPERPFGEAIGRVRTALQAIQTALHEVKTDELEAAAISQNVLDSYSVALSNSLNLEETGFPFRPKSVAVVTEITNQAPTILKFTGYPKGRLTEPRLSPSSADEPQQLLPYLASRARFDVVAFLTKGPTAQVLAGSKSELLAHIDVFKQRLAPGHEAVLLVPSLQDPRWLTQLRQSSSTSVADSSAAFLERRAGYRAERNYLGHIHDAAVYTGLVPQGSLYLLSSHAMQAARLYRHGDGRTVHVNANPAADAPSQCDLTVQWRLGVTKSSEPVWQLPYEAGDAPVR
jgi:hypothetical protein